MSEYDAFRKMIEESLEKMGPDSGFDENGLKHSHEHLAEMKYAIGTLPIEKQAEYADLITVATIDNISAPLMGHDMEDPLSMMQSVLRMNATSIGNMAYIALNHPAPGIAQKYRGILDKYRPFYEMDDEVNHTPMRDFILEMRILSAKYEIGINFDQFINVMKSQFIQAGMMMEADKIAGIPREVSKLEAKKEYYFNLLRGLVDESNREIGFEFIEIITHCEKKPECKINNDEYFRCPDCNSKSILAKGVVDCFYADDEPFKSGEYIDLGDNREIDFPLYVFIHYCPSCDKIINSWTDGEV